MIGEVLGKPDNVPILKAFISDFNFKGLRLDEALRMLTESFRLPGESQQIDRILDNFAYYYFQSNTNGNRSLSIPDDSLTFCACIEKIKSQDAAYILSFGIMMLNTDLHSNQVKRKMTLQDFINNFRGVNDSGNFDPDYLVSRHCWT